MDKVAQHLDQWKHNRAFLATIPATYPDWLVTVTFYTALHCIDALLAHDKVEGINCHKARNSVLMQTNRYLSIFRSYHPLYGLSRTVRYIANPIKWVPSEDIQPSIVDGYLHRIEKSALKLMNSALVPDKLTLLASPAQSQPAAAEVES